MSAQALSSLDNLHTEEKNTSVSIILSDKNIAIPMDVFEEFKEVLKDWKVCKKIMDLTRAFSWNEENAWKKPVYKSAFQYSFSKEMRTFFQSLAPLSDIDVQAIGKVICEKTFSGQTFVDVERPGWSEKDYDNFYEGIMKEDAEDEKNWKSFIETALCYRMSPTEFERIRTFVSLQFERLLKIYET